MFRFMKREGLAAMHHCFASPSNTAVPNLVSRHLPRPARAPTGAEALDLKRSRGLVCRLADCPVGDVWLGGSEMGGVKMSDASRSFAEDWQGREGGRGVTQQ